MQPTLDPAQFDQLIIQRLPILMRQNQQIQELVLALARENFADRKETEDRFYQLLGELKYDREEQSRKWKEYTEEQNRKWDEQNHKWDEQNRKWVENQKVINEMLESIHKLDKKYDQTMGALGTRWGLHSEDSFRNALAGILREFPSGVEVVHVNEFDDAGEVFGRPDQIELDLIIRNGMLLIAEIKSSMSRGDMYLFERKARFYEKKHQRTAQRLIVISPMVDKRAQEVATKLGVKVYSYTDAVEFA